MVMSGHKKRVYLERYLKNNEGYQAFLKRYEDAEPGTDRFDEYQERKTRKNRIRQRLYEETAGLLAQVNDPRARFMGELTFLEGFSIDEIANLSGLSEKRCIAIMATIYADIQIDS